MTKESETPAVDTTSTAIAQVAAQSTAVAESSFNMMDAMEMDSGAGMENVTQEFLQIPMLRILQAQSKELIKNDPKYIQGAKLSQIVNTLNQQTYVADIDEPNAKGIFAIAVFFQVRHIEWFKQTSKAGTGLVKIWDTEDYRTNGEFLVDKDTGRYFSKDGEREITQNCETFVIYKDDLESPGFKYAVISMTGMQFKKARAWNTDRSMRRVTNSKGKSINPPSWYGVYQLRSKAESNSKGQWFGWEIKHVADLPTVLGGSELYEEAKKMYEGITKGAIRAVDADLEEARTEGTSNSGAVHDGEDVPF